MMSKLLLPGLVAVAMLGSQAANAGKVSGGCGCCGGGQCQMNMAGAAMPMAGMPMAGMPMAAMPMAAAPSGKAAAAAEDPYGGQKTCPVSGKPLGSMGKPIAVVVKGETIYVCCQGCVAKVKADPDTYIAKVKKETGK